MPRAPHTRHLRSLLVASLCLLSASGLSAQGFDKVGVMKKKIALHRKLPAVIRFTGTTFQVKVSSQDPKHTDVAVILKDRLETELSKSNPRLQVDEKSPELIIACKITGLDQPPEQHFTKNQTVLAKGAPNAQGKQQTKAVDVPVEYKKIRGTLDISYETRDRSHRTLDAKNVVANYSEDFEAATNQAVNQSALDKMEGPFKRMFGKKTEVASGPPSPSELQDKLINEAIDQIVPRITTTNETIEVLLARGKLDEANKSAEGGLWTRYLEQLEQMTPFPKTKDDAYRLYDIGVAYEALAYQSEDEDAARKNLKEAAIHYGKAVDAKPEEKNFIEPQKRIETAMSYMRKLEAERKAFEAAGGRPTTSEIAAASAPAGTAAAASTSDSKRPTKTNSVASSKGPASTDVVDANTGASKTPNSAAKTPVKTQTGKPVKALTNDDVIKMAKEHVDDDTIIASIHDAPAVDFDLSPDGNINLTHGGVSKNVLAAMRVRAKQSNRHNSNPGST
jgi:hypothetical protein